MVIAEAIGGSEEEFARAMTRKARALGMRNTTYRNANGLPNDDQITTARDQALLGIAIQERFPKYYRYFSLASFVYRGNAMRNHNHLLGKVEGVDGIKTGFTRDFGFNLVTSVRRGPRRIVAVVLGGRSAGSRDARMRELIEANIDDASTKPGVALVAEAKPEAAAPATARSLSLLPPSPRGFRSAQRSRAKFPRRFRRVPPRRSRRSRSRPSWSNSSPRRTRPSRSRRPVQTAELTGSAKDEALAETLAAAAPIGSTPSPSVPFASADRAPANNPGVPGKLPAMMAAAKEAAIPSARAGTCIGRQDRRSPSLRKTAETLPIRASPPRHPQRLGHPGRRL